MATEKQIRYINYLASVRKANLVMNVNDKRYIFLKGEAQFDLKKIDKKTASIIIQELQKYNQEIGYLVFYFQKKMHELQESGMTREEVEEYFKEACEGSY